MSCRIYCGTPIDNVSAYLTDGYITIYGDINNYTVTQEFITACAAALPSVSSISLEDIIVIGPRAFQGLGSISHVDMYLPDTITTIGDYAFSGIGSITEITLPTSLTDEGFGDYIFKDCPSLDIVTFRIPSSLTTIPLGTFQNCNGLDQVKTTNTTAPDTIEFPNTIKTIENYAFSGCASFGHKMILPDSLQRIGAYAFANCNSLASITFGKGLNKETTGGFVPLPTPQNVTLCSHRQFRYMKVTILEASSGYSINLNSEFKHCMYQDHFMIFLNHKLVPMNSVFAHSIDETPLDRPRLYLDIPVSANDILEIFYISNDLRSLNVNVENGVKQSNTNGEPIDKIANSAYIRFQSPFYCVSSKHSIFVFLNGKKIPMSQMEDISDTIIKILNNQESCERLEIFSHIDNETINDLVFVKDGLSHEDAKITNIDLNTLQTYESPAKLDKLLNNSTDTQLNTLFETTSAVTGTVAIVNGEYQSRNQVLQRILSDYTIAGDPGEWIANVK